MTDVTGRHDNLKVGIIGFKFGRRNRIQPFVFGFAYQVLHISSFVLLGDNFISLATKIGTEYTIKITVIFKQFALNRCMQQRFASLKIRQTRSRKVLIKSNNLISGKSPPNGNSCSVQVSNTVEVLIFMASAPFSLKPLPLRFFLVFFRIYGTQPS